MSVDAIARAVVWAGPRHLNVEERATPVSAEPGQVVVRIESIGICGTDAHVWSGDNPRISAGSIVGHEFGGTIVQVGAGVQDRSPGQLVAVDPNLVCGQCRECLTGSRGRCPERELMGIDTDGGLQSFVTVDAGRTIVVPGTPDPRALALVEPIAVGVHACARAGIRAGDRLLIIGGGAIGMAAALQARDLGAAAVAVVEPDPLRRETIKEYGVQAAAPGELARDGWTVAIDTVGNGTTVDSLFGLLESGSTICVAGLAAGGTMPPATELVRRELTLTGTFCYSTGDLHVAAGLVSRHGLGALPNDLVLGLDQAPAAIQAFSTGHIGRGKTLIIT